MSLFYRSRSPSDAGHETGEPQRVLVLESHLIGDVIMGLPAYRALRRLFPKAELVFWGNSWGQELLKDQRLFDRFHIGRIPWATYDYSYSALRHLYDQVGRLRQMQIDIGMEFRGDIRNIFLLHAIRAKRRVSYGFTGGAYWLTDVVPPPSDYHIVRRNLNVAHYLGAECGDPIPRLFVPDDGKERARAYFRERGLDGIVFLHPGASHVKRQWDPLRFAKVAEYLVAKQHCPVLVRGPSDGAVVEQIRRSCSRDLAVLRVGLAELPAYLSCGDLFVGTDSGIAHIAAAVGLDVVTLFGPQVPDLTVAYGSGVVKPVTKGGFDCRPCGRRACRHVACMLAITIEDVIAAIEDLWSARPCDRHDSGNPMPTPGGVADSQSRSGSLPAPG